jgi:hypothetical protein
MEVDSMRQRRLCEQRLRQLIGADLPAEQVERLAHVDALLRFAADHDRVEGARLLLREPRCDSRPTTPRSCTRTNRYPRAGRESGICERMRLSISAALDGELSELEATRMRKHVDHCPSCAAFEAGSAAVARALRTEP